MACTEMQSRDASKIAYVTILSKQNHEWDRENLSTPTVKQLILKSIDPDFDVNKEISNDEFIDLVKNSNLSIGDKNTILDIRPEALEWKYLADRDTNSSTGFFGCALGTGDGEAIVAFRGSQSANI